MTTQKVHEGRNLKRIREIMGVKQEALALDLGDDWNQQKISLLEQKEVIDPAILAVVAKQLGVTPDAVRNFNEESAVFNIQNNYEGANVTHSPNSGTYYECSFNPIDKIMQLYEEKVALYERMLKDKEEMVERLMTERNK